MFFLNTNEANYDALKDILDMYESASGQSINREKSAITFSKRDPSSLKNPIKDRLQIQKKRGVGKYLGLPEHFSRRKQTYSPPLSIGSSKKHGAGLLNSYHQPAN